MGRLHERWKAAKSKAKIVNVNAMFRSNLGAAFDKFEKELRACHDQLFPNGGGRAVALPEPVRRALKDDLMRAKEPLGVFHDYVETMKKAALKIKAKYAASRDAAEKNRLKAESDELKMLITELFEISTQADCDHLRLLREMGSAAQRE